MNVYMKYIYPKIVYMILNHKEIKEYRINKLKDIKEEDKVLEIGFGDGQNLKYYPSCVKKIYAIDKNNIKKIKYKNIEVDFKQESASKLSYSDNTFDYVVSCFTLCSIEDVDKAIKEIYRVLKPNGKFLFLEHGKSPDKDISKRQEKYNNIFIKYGDGCHLNRDIEDIVKKTFKEVNVKKEYCNKMIKHVSYIYNGSAIKD